MLPKGILFDLDDTIIAFAGAANTARLQVCDKYSADCALSDSNDLFQAISKPVNGIGPTGIDIKRVVII